MEAYASVFKNAATAANYIGNLRWACVHLHLSMDWDTESLKMTVRNAAKRREPVAGGAAHAKRLLTDGLLQQVVAMADKLGLASFSLLALLSWECLLRVQSEAVGLHAGAACDATALPPQRHSEVWVDKAGYLCLKLARRKNKPGGSLLRRSCTCGAMGPSSVWCTASLLCFRRHPTASRCGTLFRRVQ